MNEWGFELIAAASGKSLREIQDSIDSLNRKIATSLRLPVEMLGYKPRFMKLRATLAATLLINVDNVNR